jgi:glycosyltransferase involved in cell wall biosynthesis
MDSQVTRATTICLSANTSWYLYNFRSSTIKALVGNGYRVVCLSPRDEHSPHFSLLGAEWRHLPMHASGANPIRDLVTLAYFLWTYFVLRPRIAFHFTVKNNIYGTLAASAFRIPAINNISGLGWSFLHSGLVAAVVRILYRITQHLAYRIYCQNSDDLLLLQQSNLAPADRLALMPGSGVDLSRFSPTLKRLRSTSGPLRILFAGRLLYDKGLVELFDAVARINASQFRYRLVVCGIRVPRNRSAVDHDLLRKWMQRPYVEWLASTDDMPRVYSTVDAVVLPSYREGLPRTLLEAGAMGLPAIATNVPGCRQIITHKVNGLLCEPQDAASLYAVLETFLLMSDQEREQMGLSARARVVAEYDEQSVVKTTLELVGRFERPRSNTRSDDL